MLQLKMHFERVLSVFVFLSIFLDNVNSCFGGKKSKFSRTVNKVSACNNCDFRQVEDVRGNYKDTMDAWTKLYYDDDGCQYMKMTCNTTYYALNPDTAKVFENKNDWFAFMEFQDGIEGPSEGAEVIEAIANCTDGKWMHTDKERSFEVTEVNCKREGTFFGDPTCETCDPDELILKAKVNGLLPKYRNYTKNESDYCRSVEVYCPVIGEKNVTLMVFNEEISGPNSIKTGPELSATFYCKENKWYYNLDRTVLDGPVYDNDSDEEEEKDANTNKIFVDSISCHSVI